MTDDRVRSRLLRLCTDGHSPASDALADTVDAVLDCLDEAEMDGASTVSIDTLRALVTEKLGPGPGMSGAVVDSKVVHRGLEIER